MSDPGLERLNALDRAALTAELRRCFGSDAWARRVAERAPFESRAALSAIAEEAWAGLPGEAWRAAIHEHPRIGEAPADARFAATRSWSSGEQAGVRTAGEATRATLAAGQRDYEARFGFIFLICATGKSADEILAALESRLDNDPEAELAVAARELQKIARLRIDKLLEESA